MESIIQELLWFILLENIIIFVGVGLMINILFLQNKKILSLLGEED